MTQATVLLEGLAFGEAPRWRDGRLWFSDFYRRGVYTVDEAGAEELVVEVPMQPSGLGWLPDGRLLVSSMVDRRVLRLEPDGELVLHADLADLAEFHVNDLVTDSAGGAYVGNFGYDLHADLHQREIPEILADPDAGRTRLARLAPDGAVSVAADDVRFPNGMVLLDGGRTLVLAETLRLQLTAFDVAEDGALTGRRVWASTAEQMAAPDGIAADPDAGIWIATALAPVLLRYAEGGAVTGSIETSQPTYACAVGGSDGRTVFAMTAPDSDPAVVDGQRLGRIEIARV
ncbi:SMP-30/gluconolactonase/LRE family protein [Nocardioides sambongensis]|uniref:SMP-30/gluconolactonase/LRE family protein n=1 Tax=Nocardioides sambongensis TaxID=2589074 RepID=UPI0011268FD8|nr:SMP-30/gluconolactonase/LRE family protein [Nocardioides sambongensis]